MWCVIYELHTYYLSRLDVIYLIYVMWNILINQYLSIRHPSNSFPASQLSSMVPEAQRHKQAKNRLDVIYLIYVMCNKLIIYIAFKQTRCNIFIYVMCDILIIHLVFKHEAALKQFSSDPISSIVPEAQRHKQANVIWYGNSLETLSQVTWQCFFPCEAHKLPEFKNILTLLHGPWGIKTQTGQEKIRCMYEIWIYSRNTFTNTSKITFCEAQTPREFKNTPTCPSWPHPTGWRQKQTMNRNSVESGNIKETPYVN